MDRHINAGPSWDELLLNEAYRCGWDIPQPVAEWKRLPIIRHFRALHYGMHCCDRPVPTAYQNWMTNIIWRGWC